MLEDEGIVDCDLPADFVVHGIDVSLKRGKYYFFNYLKYKKKVYGLLDRLPYTFGPVKRRSKLEFRAILDEIPNTHLQDFINKI